MARVPGQPALAGAFLARPVRGDLSVGQDILLGLAVAGLLLFSVSSAAYADIAVWDRDLYSVPVDALKDLKCELTLFQAKIVYRFEKFER